MADRCVAREARDREVGPLWQRSDAQSTQARQASHRQRVALLLGHRRCPGRARVRIPHRSCSRRRSATHDCPCSAARRRARPDANATRRGDGGRDHDVRRPIERPRPQRLVRDGVGEAARAAVDGATGRPSADGSRCRKTCIANTCAGASGACPTREEARAVVRCSSRGLDRCAERVHARRATSVASPRRAGLGHLALGAFAANLAAASRSSHDRRAARRRVFR